MAYLNCLATLHLYLFPLQVQWLWRGQRMVKTRISYNPDASGHEVTRVTKEICFWGGGGAKATGLV